MPYSWCVSRSKARLFCNLRSELGLALVAFNALTAVFQTPAGFLVDHVGARIVLICGLLLGSAAVIVAGVGVSFWVFVAMFALAGLGNAVYHPADYAMLSDRVASERIGRAFSPFPLPASTTGSR